MKKTIFSFLLLSTIAMGGEITLSEIKGEVNRKNIHCECAYPQFKFNGKSLNKINKTFVKDIENMKLTTPKKTDDVRPWNRTVTYKEYPNSYGFTSVVIFDRLDTGDRYDVTKLQNVVIDDRTGKLLDFNDIFRDEFNERVKKAIIRYVSHKNTEKGIGFMNSIDEEDTHLTNTIFYFDRDFLIVKFGNHTIAPYRSEEVEFKFAKENVVPYMHYKYGKYFPEYLKNGIKEFKFK